ncbi:MAG TPA: ABC transporter substrate-binding protein [Actinomycetes bacterium]|jgi:NitT/TauT family transport system substrate-binding protein|nr:ABC transporter substrate-binding protein [Actinomycetes bacterium]
MANHTTVGPRGPILASRPPEVRSRPLRALRRLPAAAAALALALVVGACSSGSSGSSDSGGRPAALRLGYFPNLTHATALVGIQEGVFQRNLGAGTKLETRSFNAGPAAVEALFSGAIDATYIGPNPAINAYAKSGGKAVRIVSGATSGGALLIVRPGITGAQGLRGKKIASPQLGNTQDVALRSWLSRQGLKTDTEGGGDVQVVNQENAQTLDLFKGGKIDGAWVPEPWATRLEREGGGKVLVDEASLWPGGRFVTTHLVVRTEFLTDHPDLVEKLLAGQVEANELVNRDPARAQQLANAQIEKVTGKSLKPAVVAAAWKRLTFTDDPVASSLKTSAANAQQLGLLKPVELDGIYDLGPLNHVLAARGQPQVAT